VSGERSEAGDCGRQANPDDGSGDIDILSRFVSCGGGEYPFDVNDANA
jgi:hypothetical protein